MTKTPLSEKIIAYLALFSGLSVSAVAVYYSVAGLTAIFSAAVIPIIIMGVSLEISKLIATVWLKQNWKIAHWTIKTYLLIAVALLMFITSMGIFGFLSKAHNDQNLVSGDVSAKIAVYDEKIKVEKENIDENRKILKQLDEAVDQVMARSQDEKGADKAVAIRKAQQKDRGRISQEITQSQKTIATLNDERAPIAAEVRKVEAEVGPVKYIAAFIYGSNPDSSILERAVTWIIILIVIVFDPLAVILLLASQVSFQKFRERETELDPIHSTSEHHDLGKSSIEDHFDEVAESLTAAYPQDNGPISKEYLEHLQEEAQKPTGAVTTSSTIFPEYTFGEEIHEEDDYHHYPSDVQLSPEEPAVVKPPMPIPKNIEARNKVKIFPNKSVIIPLPDDYVQNEEQSQSNLWSTATTGSAPITPTEYLQSIRDKKE